MNTQLFCASQQQPMISGIPQMVIVEQEWLQDMLSKGNVTDGQTKQIIEKGKREFNRLVQQVAAARNFEALRRASHQNEMQLT